MSGLFGKFLRDRKGAFAMQFALIVTPLIACTGLAIDGGRAFLTRYELSSALDAAALAVGSAEGTQEELESMADRFVARNFRVADATTVETELLVEDDVITLTGTSTIDTYFMPLFGTSHVTVSAQAEVRRGGADVEVALILDTTGSMCIPDCDAMDALIVAANDLVDTVVNDDQDPYFSKVALVPYANSVYLDPAIATADTLRGALTGSTAISEVIWRTGTAKTVSSSGWRSGTVKTISAATWKNGSSLSITGITKANPAVVTTSSNHGYTSGDFIYISGVAGMTQVNGQKYRIQTISGQSKKFELRTVANVNVNSSSYGTYTSSGTSQKCFTQTCEIRITTSANHGFVNGDLINLWGIVHSTTPAGLSSMNSAAQTTYTIGTASGTTFMLPGTNGPTYADRTSGGKAAECLIATCQVIVTTSASHGFTSGDYIYVSGSNFSPINNAANTSWTIGTTTSTTFIVPSLYGPTLPTDDDTDTSGTASECLLSTCEIRVTSTAHGLSSNDYAVITGVTGMSTSINNGTNASWQVTVTDANTFKLKNVNGPAYSSPGSGGTVQCAMSGCQKYRFTDAGGAAKVMPISDCITERTGAEKFTNAAPTTALMGRMYPTGTGNLACGTTNMMIPMTSDREVLGDAIDALVSSGSTSGHIGLAWGWYMLSDTWNDFWPADNEEADAQPLGAEDLVKVAILMTDGEFNTAYCNGVVSNDSGYGNNNQRINCNAPNGTPFYQAGELCEAMKETGIVIYTVGFNLAEGGGAETFMGDCATDDDHAYLAATEEELEAAFADIATSISLLRLSR